jgi:hypothetical protein
MRNFLAKFGAAAAASPVPVAPSSASAARITNSGGGIAVKAEANSGETVGGAIKEEAVAETGQSSNSGTSGTGCSATRSSSTSAVLSCTLRRTSTGLNEANQCIDLCTSESEGEPERKSSSTTNLVKQGSGSGAGGISKGIGMKRSHTVAGGEVRGWSCQVCTYLHHGARSELYLQCALCGSSRS